MKITDYCHLLLKPFCRSAKIAVDATIGNGNDILFLAKNLPLGSQIFGFDIQETALTNTRSLLQTQGIENCQLFLRNHDQLFATLAALNISKIDLAMFNLGYLPHGDKSITTTASHTIPAIEQAISMLNPHGAISVLIYPGHPEGQQESIALQTWLVHNTNKCRMIKLENYPGTPDSPFLILITK